MLNVYPVPLPILFTIWSLDFCILMLPSVGTLPTADKRSLQVSIWDALTDLTMPFGHEIKGLMNDKHRQISLSRTSNRKKTVSITTSEIIGMRGGFDDWSRVCCQPAWLVTSQRRENAQSSVPSLCGCRNRLPYPTHVSQSWRKLITRSCYSPLDSNQWMTARTCRLKCPDIKVPSIPCPHLRTSGHRKLFGKVNAPIVASRFLSEQCLPNQKLQLKQKKCRLVWVASSSPLFEPFPSHTNGFSSSDASSLKGGATITSPLLISMIDMIGKAIIKSPNKLPNPNCFSPSSLS